MFNSTKLQRNLPVIAAATRNIIIFVAVLSIPLTTAQTLQLSAAETSSWILALYGVSGLASLLLALRFRQPLLVTGNLFVIIFINGLGRQLSYPELIGAAIVAGAIVLLIGLLGLTERLAAWVPVPIVFGLLAGAVLPFLRDFFSLMGTAPAVVAGTFLAYLLNRRFLGQRVPAILTALLVGLVITLLTGQFEQSSEPFRLVLPVLTRPVFSLPAIIGAAPVFVVLIALQANVPALRFLQSQDYRPPKSVIDFVSGFGTMLGSLLGPTGISLSLPAASLVAGPGAGDPEIRHRAVYLAGGAALLIGLLAGFATALAARIPPALLLTLAGLAVVEVLAGALKRISRGPLVLGPLFAFVIALSDISILGLDNFFWSLVIGTGVSLLLERDGLRQLRDEKAGSQKGSHPA